MFGYRKVERKIEKYDEDDIEFQAMNIMCCILDATYTIVLMDVKELTKFRFPHQTQYFYTPLLFN